VLNIFPAVVQSVGGASGVVPVCLFCLLVLSCAKIVSIRVAVVSAVLMLAFDRAISTFFCSIVLANESAVGAVVGPPVAGPVVGPPVAGPVVGTPGAGPVVGTPGPVDGPPGTGAVVGPTELGGRVSIGMASH